MVSTESDPPGTTEAGRYLLADICFALKIVIGGGFGVGKTTMVNSVSEIPPLSTEAVMTQIGAEVDDLTGVSTKTTTTVLSDFGRLTVAPDIVLYLFGAPGQRRFAEAWTALLHGALAGLVLVDTRRITDSWPDIDRFEDAGVPYAVAINQFPGAATYSEQQLREALNLDPATPLVVCDARDRASSIVALRALVTYLINLYS